VSSASDAFPSVNPRPVAPDLSLRYFDVSNSVATHVKFVVTNNQCTGRPRTTATRTTTRNNNADCNASVRASEVHVAEVQVFGQNPTVDGTKVTTG
jgi:extracellular elastinolytic metalloproteinase